MITTDQFTDNFKFQTLSTHTYLSSVYLKGPGKNVWCTVFEVKTLINTSADVNLKIFLSANCKEILKEQKMKRKFRTSLEQKNENKEKKPWDIDNKPAPPLGTLWC